MNNVARCKVDINIRSSAVYTLESRVLRSVTFLDAMSPAEIQYFGHEAGMPLERKASECGQASSESPGGMRATGRLVFE